MSNAPAETSVTTTAQPAPPPAEAQNTDTAREHMIPKSRFDEVNTALADLRRKEQEREQQARQETERRAKEQGQYKELVEAKERELGELKPRVETLQERVKSFETVMETQVKARLTALPEEIRAMLPQGDVLAQFDWLAKAEAAAAKLARERSPGTPVGPRGTGAMPALTPEADAVARKRASSDYGF